MRQSLKPDQPQLDTDAELVQRTKAGDQQAFEKLMDRYWKRLCGFLYYELGNGNGDIEQMALDTFVEAYNYLDKMWDGEETFKRLLFRVAVRKKKAYWKKKFRIPYVRTYESLEVPFDQQIPQTIAAVETLTSLSEEEQRLMELYYFRGKTLEQVGKTMGICTTKAHYLKKSLDKRIERIL